MGFSLSVMIWASFYCPKDCSCPPNPNGGGWGGDSLSYECPGVTVRFDGNGGMNVQCMEKEFDCSSFHNISIGENKILSHLELADCFVPPDVSIACAARASEATGAKRLSLKRPKGELTAENVIGLGVEEIDMIEAIDQLKFPIAAFKAASHLQSFRLLSPAETVQLHTDMFLDSPPIKYLEIFNGTLTSIPDGAFNGLAHLLNLSIWENDIRNVSLDTFKGLPHLKKLVLERNPIQSYPVSVFHRAPQLTELHAKGNEVRCVEKGVFSGMQELRFIEFTGKDLVLETKAFSNLPSLNYLSIQKSGIEKLPSDLFENTTKIETLLLNGNKISTIPEVLFRNLTLMQGLDLSGNEIESITKSMFSYCDNLETLDLYNNRIKELPEYIFNFLPKLKTVNLSSNHIDLIDQAAFWGASVLKLSLSHNRLHWSECPWKRFNRISPYEEQWKLRELDLSHNQISCVFRYWQFELPQLEKLDMSYNAFTELTVDDILFKSENIEVDFRHNQITYILRQKPKMFPIYLDDIRHNLKPKLLVDHNPFACDCNLHNLILVAQSPNPKFVLGNATCAQPEQLRNNSISSLSPYVLTCPISDTPNCSCLYRPEQNENECICDSLKGLPELPTFRTETLSLRLRSYTNNLRSLPEYVRVLNLTGLGLTTISDVPKTVELLDLTNNSLRNIPVELLNSTKFKLEGNLLQCDCWNVEEVSLLQINSIRILDYENVTCLDSKLNQVDSTKLCSVYHTTVIGSFVALFGILLIALISVISYIYWLEIQVYIYDKRLFLFLLPKEDVECDKKYDVFISFTSEDEAFVIEEILPKIEGSYLATVQDRDFQVGAAIPTEIIRAIEQSRRTLIIVTCNYMKSLWASEAFRAVHSQTTKDKRSRTIVLLVDVTKKMLDKDTSAYLSLSTFIKWKDRMCWEKIKYALPRNNKFMDVAKLNNVLTTSF